MAESHHHDNRGVNCLYLATYSGYIKGLEKIKTLIPLIYIN